MIEGNISTCKYS